MVFEEIERTATSSPLRALPKGIDLALKVVARYCGETVARVTARHMEYPYPDKNTQRIYSVRHIFFPLGDF